MNMFHFLTKQNYSKYSQISVLPITDLPELLKNINFVFILLTCVSSYTGIIKIDQDLILSQA